MQNSADDRVIELFSSDMWEAQMVETLLQSAGIQCFLKNNVLNDYAFEPIFAGGVKVMILNSDFEEARKIVEEYLANRRNG